MKWFLPFPCAWLLAALVCAVVVAPVAHADGLLSLQIERAFAARALEEAPAREAVIERSVLPPARLEDQPPPSIPAPEAALQQDSRWRNLLGEQMREKNLPDPGRGTNIRNLQDARTDNARALQQRIQAQDQATQRQILR
jgi:hypothetical protein